MLTPWKKLKQEPLKTGYRKVIRKTFEMPDGKTADFDIKDEGPVVCVLALTPENNVLLVKQYRPGPEKILLELPGGGIEATETPEQAVARELLEETGFAGDLKAVVSSFECAYSSIERFNFVATDCRKIQAQNLDATEFAEVVEMSLTDFRRHLQSGQLTDIEVGYLGLDFLKLL